MNLTRSGTTLVLTGSLDVRCTAELRTALYRMLEDGAGDVRVDIASVESIDLTTLKLLAVANRAAGRLGRRVVLTGGSPGVRRLVQLSPLRAMLLIEPAAPGKPAEPAMAAMPVDSDKREGQGRPRQPRGQSIGARSATQ